MAVKVSDPQDLFAFELHAALAMERKIVTMLDTMRSEANDAALATAFERHAGETRGHAERMEKALQSLGENTASAPTPSIEGLELEHRAFAAAAADDITADVLDLEATGVAGCIEHHEIAVYEALEAMATSLGLTEVRDLLGETLAEERRMLQEGQRIAERIGRAGAVAAG
jgi:ferritin-like metal-binding protein YciE